MPIKLQKLLCYFLVLSSLGVLSSCSGWRLRGSDANIGLVPEQSVFVNGSTTSQTLILINRQLKNKNILTSQLNATRNLIINNEKWQRRSISIGRSESIVEYELTLTVNYSILDGNQNRLRGPNDLRLVRSFSYDENDITGKDKEESLLREDLTRAAARQILQQLELSHR